MTTNKRSIDSIWGGINQAEQNLRDLRRQQLDYGPEWQSDALENAIEDIIDLLDELYRQLAQALAESGALDIPF